MIKFRTIWKFWIWRAPPEFCLHTWVCGKKKTFLLLLLIMYLPPSPSSEIKSQYREVTVSTWALVCVWVLNEKNKQGGRMCPPGFAEEVIYTYKRLVSVCVVTTVLLLHHYYVYIVATTSGTVFFIFPDGQILSHEPGRVWWVHGYMGRGFDHNSPIHSPPPSPHHYHSFLWGFTHKKLFFNGHSIGPRPATAAQPSTEQLGRCSSLR